MLKVNRKAYDWGDVDLQLPGLALEVRKSAMMMNRRRNWYMGEAISPEGTEEVIISPQEKYPC